MYCFGKIQKLKALSNRKFGVSLCRNINRFYKLFVFYLWSVLVWLLINRSGQLLSRRTWLFLSEEMKLPINKEYSFFLLVCFCYPSSSFFYWGAKVFCKILASFHSITEYSDLEGTHKDC